MGPQTCLGNMYICLPIYAEPQHKLLFRVVVIRGGGDFLSSILVLSTSGKQFFF
jgi:hypothetical protein